MKTVALMSVMILYGGLSKNDTFELLIGGIPGRAFRSLGDALAARFDVRIVDDLVKPVGKFDRRIERVHDVRVLSDDHAVVVAVIHHRNATGGKQLKRQQGRIGEREHETRLGLMIDFGELRGVDDAAVLVREGDVVVRHVPSEKHDLVVRVHLVEFRQGEHTDLESPASVTGRP